MVKVRRFIDWYTGGITIVATSRERFQEESKRAIGIRISREYLDDLNAYKGPRAVRLLLKNVKRRMAALVTEDWATKVPELSPVRLATLDPPTLPILWVSPESLFREELIAPDA